MKKNSLIILFLILPALAESRTMPGEDDQGTDTLYLDFRASVELMESQNQMIESARLNQKRANLEKKAAAGMYFPSIGASATYSVMSDPLELDLTPVRDAITPLYETLSQFGTFEPATYSSTIKAGLSDGLQQIQNGEWVKEIQRDQFGMADINVNWPLYAGGRIRLANKAAKIGMQEADHEYEYTWSQQHVELVQRYYGLQLVRQVADLRKEVMDGMAQHLNDANKMKENGMMAEAERLHAEVAFAEATREYKKALKDVELMETALRNTLATDRHVVPVSELFIVPVIKDRQYYIVEALANNPQLKLLNAKKNLADLGIKKERAAFLPNVALMGTKELYEHDLSEYIPDWFFGVGLQINLFDGMSKFRKVSAAKVQKQRVVTIEEKARQDIVTLVTKVHQELQKALEEYQSTQASLKFAEEYYRVRNKAFREGFASSSDVVDARLNLFKVKTEQLKAMYNYDLAWASLLAITGSSDQFMTAE
ncbi:TolC family protein [Thermophagus sp. OGC60D27]|uniref:TolC family protein n=1 Tax=Thermophagus sp. OGC60D27 TaxID=3458415 RepID=UPI004037D5BF